VSLPRIFFFDRSIDGDSGGDDDDEDEDDIVLAIMW
jgi:hypothetical protein